MEILLRANAIEGITKADFADYPEAEVLAYRDFYNALKDADEKDIFTCILPAGTDGSFESLDAEYGIH
jgi:hypothetical protein